MTNEETKWNGKGNGKGNTWVTRRGYQYYNELIKQHELDYIEHDYTRKELISVLFMDFGGALQLTDRDTAINEMLTVGTELVYRVVDLYRPLDDYTDPCKTMNTYRYILGELEALE